MLGSLARWLRILGYDTLYAGSRAPPMNDDALLKTAWREKRMVLTRDGGMGAFGDVRIHLIKSGDLDEQLGDVVRTFGLEIKDPLSRCSECNGPIESVSKEDCRGKVPEGTFETQDEFWFCRTCGKYYWAGSHWGRIMERVEALRRLRD